MILHDMHKVFRTLAQQMGLQLVRGILPEAIDTFINDSIIEKVQLELLTSVRTAIQENVNTQGSAMSAINTFRTLYRTARYKIAASGDVDDETGTKILSYYNSKNGFHIINLPTLFSDVSLDSGYKIVPMMFLGFSVEYAETMRGNAVACRLIGSDVLETTLRDFCNGASKESPIVCLSSIPVITDSVEVLNERCSEQLEIYTNSTTAPVQYLNVKYIKAPAIVKFDVDASKCVNCDLPDYTHYDIVERAAVKFLTAINQGQGQQQQQQQQQQQ